MHFGAILGPGVVYKLMKAEKCLFSAKIADLQKFRLRNFGRGGVSGAAEKFLNYKYKLLSPKKFSWSYENFKFVSQKEIVAKSITEIFKMFFQVFKHF